MTENQQITNKAAMIARLWRRRLVRMVRLPRHIAIPLVVFLCVSCAVVLLYPFASSVQSFDLPQVGHAAKETVIAPFTFDIIKSPEELARERRDAMEKTLYVLDYDPLPGKRMRDNLLNLKRAVAKLGAGKPGSDSSVKIIRQELDQVLSESAIDFLINRPSMIDNVIAIGGEISDKGIASVLLVPSKERLREQQERYNAPFDNYRVYNKQYVTLRKDSLEATVDLTKVPVLELALENGISRFRKGRKFDADALNTVYELLSVYLKPNISINESETAEQRRIAAQSVLEISGKVIKDTEIVRKHEEVTTAILQKLKSLRAAIDRMENVQERKRIWLANAGRILLVLILLLFFGFYIWKYQPSLIKKGKHLIAFAVILVFQVFMIRFCLFLLPKLFEGAGEIPSLVPEYFIPTSVGAILVAILFGKELSFLFTFFISSYFGIVLGFNLFMFLFTLLGGIMSGLSASDIRYRREYFKTVPQVLVIYVLTIVIWHLIGHKLSFLPMLQNFGLAAINVGSSLFLAMTLTPLFERFFDITTDMTLVELSDMNHPILKRLSIEAAGTYNHSVLVGNLAESAAERIGANPLFARVASYYHDIGKIEKADYFVENALSLEKNRHNKLAPSMSALIILSHVKDGLELARSYKLPQVIQEVIVQHHGTSQVSFFYEKALEQDPHKQVQEQDFRYSGPSPQARETAIIMLADSVEAASRSLGTSSPKLLRDLVKKIIRDKFMDGQLDQCNLTLRDLDGIVEGFMPILQGMFHSRIEYPSK